MNHLLYAILTIHLLYASYCSKYFIHNNSNFTNNEILKFFCSILHIREINHGKFKQMAYGNTARKRQN